MANDGLEGVVAVDYGSTDQTATRIKACLESSPVPVSIVRLSRNFGHQPAVVAGFHTACQLAKELLAGWVGIIDGGLQDRPEDFSRPLDNSDGQDVVFAVRAQCHDCWLIRNIALLFYKFLSEHSNFPIPPNAGAYSIIRTPVCKLTVESTDSEPYFSELRAWAGSRQERLPLDRQARASEGPKVALRGLACLYLRALVLHMGLPLKLILVSTALMFAVLFILSALGISLRLSGITLPTGITAITLVHTFSLVLFSMFFLNKRLHTLPNQIQYYPSKTLGSAGGH